MQNTEKDDFKEIDDMIKQAKTSVTSKSTSKTKTKTRPTRQIVVTKHQNQFLDVENVGREQLIERLFCGSVGAGKAQPYSSIVYTPSGPKLMGDLQIGDIVCTPDGNLSHIEYISEHGEKDIYTISFNDGTTAKSTLDHLWSVSYNRKRSKGHFNRICWTEKTTKILTLEQLLDYKKYCIGRDNNAPFIEISQPIQYYKQDITIDPYLLGLLIGDGCFRNKTVSLTSADKEIIDNVEIIIFRDYLGRITLKSNNKLGYTFRSERIKNGWHKPWNIVIQQIKDLGLINKLSINKFIPNNYKYNTYDIRLALLQGLMDTDGWVEKKGGACYFGSTSEQLAKDTKELAEGLGYQCCNYHKVTKTCTNSATKATCEFFMFRINCDNSTILFRLKRKKQVAEKYIKTKYFAKRIIRKIEKTGIEKARCIKISNNNGLYLTDNCVITHNSTSLVLMVLKYAQTHNTVCLMLAYHLSSLKKSTLPLLINGTINKKGEYVPPLLPSECIKSFNRTEGEIHLTNGSKIILSGVQDAEKLKSINAHMAVIDEITNLRQEDYFSILQRCRMYHPLPNGCFAACNPQTKQHWVYRYFFDDKIDGYREAITVNSYSNRDNLPEAYIKSLENLPELERRKMLMGEWINNGSNVFYTFNPENHVINLEKWKKEDYSDFILSVDFGGGGINAYSGAHFMGKTYNGTIHILDEFTKSKTTHREMLEWLEQYRSFTYVVVSDSANAAFASDLENASWRVVKSIKDIEGSIAKCNSLLKDNKIIFSINCKKTIKQIEEATRDPDTNKIDKIKGWDLIDSWRYSICAFSDELLMEKNKEKPNNLYCFTF